MQAIFLNRQALYLRPDPARVIVRPFKPATEPRDLNPTDKTRANHIVDRVLALSSEAASNQLADVLENFEGRHRNLLETFESRADEMEEALAAHGTFSKIQRQLIGAVSPSPRHWGLMDVREPPVLEPPFSETVRVGISHRAKSDGILRSGLCLSSI